MLYRLSVVPLILVEGTMSYLGVHVLGSAMADDPPGADEIENVRRRKAKMLSGFVG